MHQEKGKYSYKLSQDDVERCSYHEIVISMECFRKVLNFTDLIIVFFSDIVTFLGKNRNAKQIQKNKDVQHFVM